MTTSTLTSCLKITRRDAVVLGLTEHDRDLNISGVDYIAGAGYTPTEAASNDQLSVNNADVEGLLSLLGVDLGDIRAGLYDHAEIEWFVYDWQALTVVKTMMRGYWGETRLLRGRFVAEFRSLAQALQQTIGEVTSPTCRANFGDARCGLLLATYTVTGTVTGLLDERRFFDSGRTEADGYFAYGLLTWTSGNNLNRQMEVKIYLNTGGAFELFRPMPETIQLGDGYSVYAGCDKQASTCKTKFLVNNIVNFRGEPHLPGNEQILKFGGQ